MRNLNYLNPYRQNYLGILGDSYQGKFIIPKNEKQYQVLATTSYGWDHVSISVLTTVKGKTKLRMARWEELEEIKMLFYNNDEPVMQIHPTKEEYVNMNEYVLHLWKPNTKELPTPPIITEVKDYNVIQIPKTNQYLRILHGEKEDWDCFEVQVIENKKPITRYPSWTEMCIAKNYICGENQAAFEYHSRETTYPYTTRFYLPPKEIKIPLPPSILVGLKNSEMSEEMKKLIKKINKQ